MALTSTGYLHAIVEGQKKTNEALILSGKTFSSSLNRRSLCQGYIKTQSATTRYWSLTSGRSFYENRFETEKKWATPLTLPGVDH